MQSTALGQSRARVGYAVRNFFRRSPVLDGMTPRYGTEERRRHVYRDALEVIARQYATDLQIDDVARAVACSRRQMQRVFAEIGNTSFRELLATARMFEARRLLARPDVQIQEVAARVGYHHSTQFSKSFRRRFGVSPRGYRRRVLASDRPSGTAALLFSGCTTEPGRVQVDK
jgi:AraC family transcriptional regulator of adaptative response / methylphosphotriester-DNA alkyltransferase methyltransferase